MSWDDILAASFLSTGWIIVLAAIGAFFFFLASPDLNTVTIHKQQDRLQLPCPNQGEGGH